MRVAVRVAVAACMMFFAREALACHVFGQVTCLGTGAPVAGVVVNVQGPEGFVTSFTTAADGSYDIWLPAAGAYSATLDLNGVDPAGYVYSPASPAYFTVSEPTLAATVDWVVSVAGCGKRACWLTGGGAKFSTVLGINVAERGPKVNLGGNVYPSCSSEPGDGGQWNHVDHELKLFFQGTQIRVDDCGNVDDIPPGSTSPVTPYNYIEYHGTGTLKGIAGNRYSKTDACFVARAEDRNEPGSTGQRDGAYKDRYFLRVFDCVTNEQLLVLERTVGAGDPITITDGNLQIHVSSCAGQ